MPDHVPLPVCEACGGEMTRRKPSKTHVCMHCRAAGAAFARGWAAMLRDDRGLDYDTVALVVGLPNAETARARVSEHHRRTRTRQARLAHAA